MVVLVDILLVIVGNEGIADAGQVHQHGHQPHAEEHQNDRPFTHLPVLYHFPSPHPVPSSPLPVPHLLHITSPFQHTALLKIQRPRAHPASKTAVGYQNKNLKDAKQALSTGFVSIGAKDKSGNPVDGVYLTDLIPSNIDECYGDIVIEMLDGAGVAKSDSLEVYSYYCNARGYDEDGWYNDEDQLIGGEEVDDVFFPAGTGFWVTGVDGATWSTAGQVYEADKSIPLHDAKQMLCNPYATSIFLARDISIGECDECYGDVVIEMLDGAGVAKSDTLEVYSYYCNARGYDEDGWYNDEDQLIGGEEVEDVEFPACTGLWVTGVDGFTFDITSPLK